MLQIAVTGQVMSKDVKQSKDGKPFRIVKFGWMGGAVEAFTTEEEFNKIPPVGQSCTAVYEGRLEGTKITGLGKLVEVRPMPAARAA